MGLLFVGAFGLFLYYFIGSWRAIRNGDVSPLLEAQLESTVSQARSNQQVRKEDLAKLTQNPILVTGPENAALTVVTFVDYDCPYTQSSIATLRSRMVREKDVRFIIRDFPLEELHPNAMLAAQAVRCAQEQGKGWQMHDTLFAQTTRRSEADYEQMAASMGLDESVFHRCLLTRKQERVVREDQALALMTGVQGTPTTFFNDVRIQGGMNEEILDYLLKRMKQQP